MKLCVVYNLVVILLIAPSIILSHPQTSHFDFLENVNERLDTVFQKSALQEAFRIIENEHTDCQFSTDDSSYVRFQEDCAASIPPLYPECNQVNNNWSCEIPVVPYRCPTLFYDGCSCAQVVVDVLREKTNIDPKKLGSDYAQDVYKFLDSFTPLQNQITSSCISGVQEGSNAAGGITLTSSIAGNSAIDSFSPVGLSKRCTRDLPCWFGSGQRCCQMRQWGRSERWRCPKSC